MKKITRNKSDRLIVEYPGKILVSKAYWNIIDEYELEIFGRLRKNFVAHGPVNTEGESVGFHKLDSSMKNFRTVDQILYDHGNYSTKMIIANPSDDFIKNIPSIVMDELNNIGDFTEEALVTADKITGCDWFFLNDGNEYDEPIY